MPPSTHALRFLAAARILVGSGTLILPSHTAWVVGLSPSIAAAGTIPGMLVIARLFGVRDMVMGGYLWRSLMDYRDSQFARSTTKEISGGSGNTKAQMEETEPLVSSVSLSQDAPRNIVVDEEMKRYSSSIQLRNALWLGMICDIIDVGSCMVSILQGDMHERAIVLACGGAVLFASIGMISLTNLKR